MGFNEFNGKDLVTTNELSDISEKLTLGMVNFPNMIRDASDSLSQALDFVRVLEIGSGAMVSSNSLEHFLEVLKAFIHGIHVTVPCHDLPMHCCRNSGELAPPAPRNCVFSDPAGSFGTAGYQVPLPHSKPVLLWAVAWDLDRRMRPFC
jgi:hypothetical protein